MAPLAVHLRRDLILRRGGGVRRGVNWGQNVAEIKQIISELKEELNLFKSTQGFKKDKCRLLKG